MVAEFYIIPASFEDNKNLSKDEIEEKTRNLEQDFRLIRQYKETNKIFVNVDIYSVCFINDVTINDLLNDSEIGKKSIGRDEKRSLQKIIVESAKTKASVKEIIEVFLPNHNENKCCGLIAFKEVENIKNEYQIVYSINNWYTFRRHFLGKYPHLHDGVYFIEECKIFFPNLFFHERNKTTVLSILGICSQRIVFHLAALNDKFKTFYRHGLNRDDLLKEFSLVFKLDEIASPERKPSRKEKFTFDFINDKGIMERVCCEPHLKLCRTDNYPKDGSYSTDRRIYFHEGKPDIQNGKILIGHIGRHL